MSTPVILLTGAGSTGKSVLAEKLADLYNVPLLPSCARQVHFEFGLKNEDDQLAASLETVDALQHEIAQRGHAEAMALYEDGDGYTADRTTADRFAYRMVKHPGRMSQAELLWYETRVMEQLTTPDSLVVYCPTGIIPLEDDAFRTQDPVARSLFDIIIRGILDTNRGRINLLPLNVEGVETRMHHIHSALLNLGVVQPESDKEARLVVH